MKFTVTIHSEVAIKKLKSLGHKKGEYISKLIEVDIRLEQIEARLKRIEEGKKG